MEKYKKRRKIRRIVTSVVIILAIISSIVCHTIALQQRKTVGIGGEGMLLLLPFIVNMGIRNWFFTKDTMEDYKSMDIEYLE